MGLELRSWDDDLAVRVFRALDPLDHIEAELALGHQIGGYGLFAEWRGINALRHCSLIAVDARMLSLEPFAVLGVAQTGFAGVASAALLARDHARFRILLARLAVVMRKKIGAVAEERGLHRIECRCWSEHPTAARLLEAIGFNHEADLPGFGARGDRTFRQYAWTRTEESGNVF